MATGTVSDFQVYEEQFHSGATEVMMQEAGVFNEASAGTILLSTKAHKGNYVQEAFYQELAGLVTRRAAGVGAATDIAMTQGEDVKVKLDRKIGPVAQSLDAFRKIAKDPQEMSFILGQQWGKAILVDYVNTSLVAADNAFAQDLSFDAQAAAAVTMNHGSLVQTMAQLGDAGKNVRAFVMHSKQYYDLMGQSIADNITDVASVTVHNGTVASLGRPVIVSDVAGLIDVGAGFGAVDAYHCLALTAGAIQIEESEEREIVSDLITGLENLVLRYQGEYAYSIGLKGYAWDMTNGGINPLGTALNTATNWDKVAADDKSLGGVQLITT